VAALAACAAARADMVVGSLSLQSTPPMTFEWLGQRAHRFIGSSQVSLPAVDYVRGRSNIGYGIDLRVGGPAVGFGPQGEVRPPVGAPIFNVNGGLSAGSSAEPPIQLALSAASAQYVSVGPGATVWQAQAQLNAGYVANNPSITGWGTRMGAANLSGSPVTVSTELNTSIRGADSMTAFNSVFASASLAVQQASISFTTHKRRLPRDPSGADVPPPDAMLITAQVKSSAGSFVPLQDFAHSMGFDHFNWINLIRSTTAVSSLLDCRGELYAQRTPGVLNREGAIDPPPCGFKYQVKDGDPKPADNWPFYFDVARSAERALQLDYDDTAVKIAQPLGIALVNGDGSTGFKVINSPSQADLESATALRFMDIPSGADTYFSTFLVGVRRDGTFEAIGDKVFEWRSFYGFIFDSGATEVVGPPPELPPFAPIRFSEVGDIGDLRTEDAFTMTPLTFADFTARYGLSPSDFARRAAAAALVPSEISSPAPLWLLAAAGFVAMRRRFGSVIGLPGLRSPRDLSAAQVAY
jgi:hypothetical protein